MATIRGEPETVSPPGEAGAKAGARSPGVVVIPLRGDERLLIVKMSSIGDVIHALPAATALRRTYPGLRISWLIEDRFAALVANHPSVDRVVAIPSLTRGPIGRRLAALREGRRRLREEPYDVALELQGLFWTSLIASLSGAPVRVGRARRREGANLLTRRIRTPRGCHAVEESLACASYLGATPGPVRFDLPIEPAAVESVEQMLLREGLARDARLAVLNPSASAEWKHWPAENWGIVARELSREAAVVTVGALEQQPRHREIISAAGGGITDLTGQTTLAGLIAILARCAVHIAGDTGSSHIAAALGRPVVGIYGASDPQRLAPWGQADLLLSGIATCGPFCPRWCSSGRRCLRAVTPDRVVAHARRALAAPRSARDVRAGGDRAR